MVEAIVITGLLVLLGMVAWVLYDSYYNEDAYQEGGEDEMKKKSGKGEESAFRRQPSTSPLHDWVCDLDCRLEEQEEMIKKLIKQGAHTMATLQEVKAELAAVKQAIIDEKAEVDTQFADHQAQIQALKDQLASGSPVTQADLDELLTAAQELRAGVAGITTPNAPQ